MQGLILAAGMGRRLKVITGFNILANFSINKVFSAIFIIPVQKHIVPNKVKHNFTVSCVLLKIATFKLSIFPKKIAYKKEIIINIGQILFNKLIT